MFSPFYMKALANQAMIHRADTIVPLIKEEFLVVDVEREEEASFPLSPMACALILLAITCWVVGRGIHQGRIAWAWDAILFGFQGVGGIIIGFLFFF